MPPTATTVGWWILGGVGAVVLFRVLAGITETFQSSSQKRIVTSVALLNGVLLEIGLSPMGTLASELVSLTPLLTIEYSSLIRSLLIVGTILEILYGITKMWEGSGALGVIAFVLAFIAGTLIPYQDTTRIGIILIAITLPALEFSPTNQRRNI